MPNRERLLERISAFGKNPEKRDKESKPEDVEESIANYITKLVNIKKGNLLTDKELGMPDFTDYIYNYPESVRNIERAVEKTIRQCEPRLGKTKVEFIGKNEHNFSLDFRITAIQAEQKDQFAFDTTINKSGIARRK